MLQENSRLVKDFTIISLLPEQKNVFQLSIRQEGIHEEMSQDEMSRKG